MSYEPSFGQLDASEAEPARPGAEAPFRIVILGDFSGRTGRSAAKPPIKERKLLKIDFNNLEDVLESVGPQLELSLANDVAASIEFSELDDFHPDALMRSVDHLSDSNDDDTRTAAMREVLHHPQFQALEGTWRGVEWLLRRVVKNSRIKALLLDLTHEELIDDLRANDDLKLSGIFQQLVASLDGPDADPWGLIVGNFEFQPTTVDTEVLGRMAKIASAAGAPFLATMSTQVLDENIAGDEDFKGAWEALRQLPEAASLGLATPKFLLRPPYGENYKPAEAFNFEEFGGQMSQYMWGQSSLAVACVLAKAFTDAGAVFKPGAVLQLEAMPMHAYRDANDDDVAVMTEIRFATTTGQQLTALGLMPVLAVRGRDWIELAVVRSVATEAGELVGLWLDTKAKSKRKIASSDDVAVGMDAGAKPISGSKSKAAAKSDDPETDDELAAMLAGKDGGDDDGGGDDDEGGGDDDEDSSSDSGDDDEMDPDLAALMGGDDDDADSGDDDADEEESSDDDSGGDELDPDLAALLGDLDDDAGGDDAGDEESSDDDSSGDELDPDLAALLGDLDDDAGGDDDDDAGDDEEEEEAGLDPELAALLGDLDEDVAAAAEEETSEPDEDPALDAELAALLGDLDAEPTEEEEAELNESDEEPEEEAAEEEEDEGLDPDLAALLNGLDDEPDVDLDDLDKEVAEEDEEASEVEEESSSDDEDIDPELAAMLGGGDDDDEADEEEEEAATDDEIDPELAALLGGGDDEDDGGGDDEDDEQEDDEDEPADEDGPVEDELDPDLAALLGDLDGDSEAADEEEPADTTEDEIDPDLAALLGDMEDEPDDEAAEEEAEEPVEEEAEEEVAEEPAPPPRPAPREEPTKSQPVTRSAGTMTASLDEQIAASNQVSRYGEPGSGEPPLLDFKSLLKPIPGDTPEGESVPFSVREKLDISRKEINPALFAADDPLRPKDFVKADWPGIIETTQEILRETSKNLLIAARLLEALARQRGFGGLRDGLHLMRLMVDVCWDRLEPPAEEDDNEVRAAPFNWLDDSDRAAMFPSTVRRLPLITGGGQPISFFDWQQSQTPQAKIDAQAIEQAIMKSSRDQCQTVHDNVLQCHIELRFLTESLVKKLGHDAPGFSAIRPAIEECLNLARQVLQKKGPAPTAMVEAEVVGPANESGGAMVMQARPVLNSRESVYSQLAEAAAALQRLEPHSPVPFLVMRAVELGALPFPQLMQALIRDASVLSEMNRELGIKAAEEESSE